MFSLAKIWNAHAGTRCDLRQYYRISIVLFICFSLLYIFDQQTHCDPAISRSVCIYYALHNLHYLRVEQREGCQRFWFDTFVLFRTFYYLIIF